MKALIDTNVILDVWLKREPFFNDSLRVLSKVESKEINGFLCPTTIATLHYIGKKELGETRVRKLLTSLLSMFKLGRLDTQTIEWALTSKINDFEDAVLEAVAKRSALELIISRNKPDFKRSIIKVIEPSELY